VAFFDGGENSLRHESSGSDQNRDRDNIREMPRFS
jgi:hypothetical protein